MKQIYMIKLPRKALRVKDIGTVPQTDTGGLVLVY